MKKRILLYNPKEATRVRIPHVPFSLLTIGSALKEHYDVVIVDGRIEPHPEKLIDGALPGTLLFGITCMSGTPILDALAMAARVRSLRPDIPIVWGGFHPTLVPETTIRHPLADILVLGQGEATMQELARALEQGKPLHGIKGIIYKSEGEIVRNEPRPAQDINAFPKIDYSLIGIHKYLKNDAGTRTLDYLSGRGCPYSCSFCCINTMYGKRYYSYPAHQVVDEIERLMRVYGVNGIRFMDDNFFVNRARVADICAEIARRRLKFSWWAMCRIDEMLKFDDAFWRTIKGAGLAILNVGVESGSQKVLDRISKNITAEMTLRAAGLLKRYGIEAQFSFMAGFPFETEEDLKLTMELINGIAAVNPAIDMGLFIYTPNPGTPLFQESLRNGFKGYASLAEWGTRCDYFQGTAPWLTKRERDDLEIASYLVQFAFGTTLQRKLKPVPRLFHKMLSWDAKLRWKLGFLRFPWEWRLIRLLTNGFA